VLKKIDFIDDYRYGFPSDLNKLEMPGFKKYLPFFEKLYLQNFDSPFEAKTPKIPKILHFFYWDGNFKKTDLNFQMKSCIDLHPGWEVKLWTYQNLSDLDSNTRVINKLKKTKQFAMMKTYYQSMVLPKYGGVFMDTDYICLKPFDELVYKYEYFAGLEPYTVWTFVPIVNTGLQAAVKDSKVMK